MDEKENSRITILNLVHVDILVITAAIAILVELNVVIDAFVSVSVVWKKY